MEKINAIKGILSTTQTGIDLATQIDGILEVFRPFKPEVKSFRINYIDRSSEIRYLVTISSGLKRKTHRILELPATTGFRIDEVLDLETFNFLNFTFDSVENKWIFNANNFPKSEKFLITVKGKVTEKFLDSLVSVKCATNPTRKKDMDCYWIHSALKDVSIFEKIWDELDIKRVNTDVRIGVERYFGPAIPKEIKKKFETKQKLLDAIAQGQRNIEGLKLRYRQATKKTTISPSDLLDVITRLVSGDFFAEFIGVDTDFTIGSIKPKREITSIIPEGVMIDVYPDLNYKSPTAQGNLIFERKRYIEQVKETIDEFIPSKKKK